MGDIIRFQLYLNSPRRICLQNFLVAEKPATTLSIDIDNM
ncbi:unnamed protein product, partial [marine sediment metagenome]